ncbi:hypothetical protein DICPUDRAFT_99164 [Dictyostelium purpureum]|uniref:Uncharacterized protein n=1 Tax=Dictyostelium purpureum TaxID=5786 RepID=F0ZWS7_DICPU|nr:uncharacterized protein DICPUDRAFT_99164 [Dictyostelium purpureum]EGC31614.1 hypothetical protein DICPUDRAFT_99164 [Dictyostelium purpureum]|eukprot:XP_003291872.1 hypothetical protein DICPUDRAFT_99164 [Dictyostelium purpureum]
MNFEIFFRQRFYLGIMESIVVLGFVGSGKSSFYQNIRKEYSKYKIAFIFDGLGSLPESVLQFEQYKGSKVLIQDVALSLSNGSTVTIMEDEFIQDFILPNQYDYVVFFSHPFESNFLIDVLQYGSEQMEGTGLGEFISKIKLVNIVTVLDAEKLLNDLKSNNKVGEMMKIVGEEQEEQEEEENHEKTGCSSKKDDCCKDGKCSNEKTDDCCKDGKCSKNSEQQQFENEEDLDDCEADIEELTNTADKLVSTLILEQISISNIIILNKIEKISKEDLEFIQKLLNLISSSLIIETNYSKVKFELLFGYVITVRNYQLENQTNQGISILNYYQRKPFHPERFSKLVYDEKNKFKSENFKGVLLLTGLVWFATDMKNKYIFEIMENKEVLGGKRPFWSTLDENEWNPSIKENIEREIKLFKYQDRKIELSIVGLSSNQFDQELMLKKLDECLLTDKEMEMGPNEWESYNNPLKNLK